MREIVTLQLGNLSNYTATHFWNAQESYFTYGELQKSPVDHNIHWRAGVGHDGSDTFLPRAVIYDLKGAFGSLRKINPLYDGTAEADAAANSLWHGHATVHKQDALSPSAYQQGLDEGVLQPPRPTPSSVRYWSDFSRVYFHPRSLVQLYDFELDSTIRPFERFAMGVELFGSLDKEHDIVDRDWRPFVEECDLMQGMQVFTTLDDAWGGFASSYLEALRDEYPKSCIWVWGLEAPLVHVPREKRQLRLANSAQALTRACSQASMVVPLSLPAAPMPAAAASLDPSSAWHVSGLFSTVAESATLQSRLAGSSTLLGDMAECLNTTGRQTLAAAAMDVGHHADIDSETPEFDLFQIGRGAASAALAVRNKQKPERAFGCLSSYRGLAPPEKSARTGDGAGNQAARPAVGSLVIRQYHSTLQFPLLDSFPTIYPGAPATEAGMAVRTVLRTTSAMRASVKNMQSQASRSIALDEREALSSDLADIADAYQDDWSSGDDQDDDDL